MSRTRQGHVMYAHIRPFGWASEGALKPPDLVRPGSMASDSLTRGSKELGWSENNTSLSVIVVLSCQVLNVQKQLAKEMLGEILIMISSGVCLRSSTQPSVEFLQRSLVNTAISFCCLIQMQMDFIFISNISLRNAVHDNPYLIWLHDNGLVGPLHLKGTVS